jgi:hypothetical protein
MDIETVYETLAETIDDVGPDRTPLVLAKAALALAHELGDWARAVAIIEAAAADPDRPE